MQTSESLVKTSGVSIEVYMNQFCYTKGSEISEPVGCKALRQDHLIVLAMLLGCDYTLGVHGVGIVNGPLGLTLAHALFM